MKRATALALIAFAAPSVIAGHGCLEDLYICPNGQGVGRDPNNNCKFFPCRDASETKPPQPTRPVFTDAPSAAPSAVATTVAVSSNLTDHKGVEAGNLALPAYNWTDIDAKIPHALEKLLNASFANYHSPLVCGAVNVSIAAAEKAALASNTTTALYHIVMDVNCTAPANASAPPLADDHLFVLEVTEDHAGMYLSQCGHRENGTVRNWLTIQDEMTMCQTPRERAAFLHQSFNHTTHAGATKASVMDSIKEYLAAPEMPILGVAVATTLAVLLVAVVVIKRARRRGQVERSVLAEVEEAHEEHKNKKQQQQQDEEAPTTNPLESTTAAPRQEGDSELTSVKL